MLNGVICHLEAINPEKINTEKWLGLFEVWYGLDGKPADQKARWCHVALGCKAADSLGLVTSDAMYDMLQSNFIQCYGSVNAMLEAQDGQVCLQLGDRMLCQLVIRVQELVAVAFKGVDEAVRESYGVNVFL